nr:hypothetical protein BaRGS_029978 [Batillaria attramentaria]
MSNLLNSFEDELLWGRVDEMMHKLDDFKEYETGNPSNWSSTQLILNTNNLQGQDAIPSILDEKFGSHKSVLATLTREAKDTYLDNLVVDFRRYSMEPKDVYNTTQMVVLGKIANLKQFIYYMMREDGYVRTKKDYVTRLNDYDLLMNKVWAPSDEGNVMRDLVNVIKPRMKEIFAESADIAFPRLAFYVEELQRGCLAVIDVGLHHMRWSRNEALFYLWKRLPFPNDVLATLVDRVITWPGQATAPLVGQHHFLMLRETTKIRKGDSFDLIQFHSKILQVLPGPLALLDTVLDGTLGEVKPGPVMVALQPDEPDSSTVTTSRAGHTASGYTDPDTSRFARAEDARWAGQKDRVTT